MSFSETVKKGRYTSDLLLSKKQALEPYPFVLRGMPCSGIAMDGARIGCLVQSAGCIIERTEIVYRIYVESGCFLKDILRSVTIPA